MASTMHNEVLEAEIARAPKQVAQIVWDVIKRRGTDQVMFDWFDDARFGQLIIHGHGDFLISDRGVVYKRTNEQM